MLTTYNQMSATAVDDDRLLDAIPNFPVDDMHMFHAKLESKKIRRYT